jgi:hypothetical protein
MIQAVTENTQRSKSNSHRIDELAGSVEALNKMALALEVLATKQNVMADTVHAINEKVTALEERPVKRIYAVIGYFVASVISAAVGAWFGFSA